MIARREFVQLLAAVGLPWVAFGVPAIVAPRPAPAPLPEIVLGRHYRLDIYNGRTEKWDTAALGQLTMFGIGERTEVELRRDATARCHWTFGPGSTWRWRLVEVMP